MTAAKISLREGYGRGIMFSAGVCFTVIFQTYIASIFARYISNHHEVVDILQRIAFVVLCSKLNHPNDAKVVVIYAWSVCSW